MATELLIILVLVLANGLFAGAEIAVLTAGKGKLQTRAAARAAALSQSRAFAISQSVFSRPCKSASR